jgi:hypothetical protein
MMLPLPAANPLNQQAVTLWAVKIAVRGKKLKVNKKRSVWQFAIEGDREAAKRTVMIQTLAEIRR